MRRCNVGGPCLLASLRAGRHVQAIFVNRHRAPGDIWPRSECAARANIKGQLTHAERSLPAHPRGSFVSRKHQSGVCDWPRRATHSSRSRTRDFRRSLKAGQGAGHESSLTHAAPKISLSQKLRVRVKNRYSRNPQFHSERSNGRYPFPCA